MSPNPGELGHEQRGWTHRMCNACWAKEHDYEPVRVALNGPAPCCYCGQPTDSGIYVRGSAADVHGAQP